ncbi:MAG: BlaI/MecI/CopY family transcriptional regulator [Sphingobacteriales bacterium]|nr:MAG: BlaI/MecI/CopY family transcriptional regulator [Sphingobacteriales bacterium]
MQVKPTDSELEILNILWEKGDSTVREIHEVLEQTKEVGYTTTLKLMQIMHDKKLLTRDTSSKTHIYKAAISKGNTQGQIVQRMVDNVFNGSTMQLVMQALGNHKTSTSELDAIREYLNQIEKENNIKNNTL